MCNSFAQKKETGLAINAGRFPLIVVSRWFDKLYYGGKKMSCQNSTTKGIKDMR